MASSTIAGPSNNKREACESPVKPRKRQRNVENWERNVKKAKKAKGEEHTSYKGTLIPAWKIGPPCSCKRRCFEKFSDDEKGELSTSVKYKERNTTGIKEVLKQLIGMAVQFSE